MHLGLFFALVLIAVLQSAYIARGALTNAELSIVVPRTTDDTAAFQTSIELQADHLVTLFSHSRPEISIVSLPAASFGGLVTEQRVDFAAFASLLAPALVPALFVSGEIVNAGRRRLLHDIQPLLERHGVLDAVPEVLRKTLALPGGGLMALPTGGDVLKLFCPAAMLGDDGRPPETFEELLVVLQRAKEAGIDVPLVASSTMDLISDLMLRTYGPAFTQQVIDGEVSLLDDRLRPWGEALEMLHVQGLAGSPGSVIGTLLGDDGCIFIGAPIYSSIGLPQPASMVGPFDLPGIQGHRLEDETVRAAVATIAVSFVPARSRSRDIGLDIMDFGITTRLELVRRGGPYSDDERTALGSHVPGATLEELRRAGLDEHAAALERQHELDAIIIALGIGSPVEISEPYIDFVESTLFNASRSDVTATRFLNGLECLRVERLLSRAVQPKSDVEAGRYADDVELTLRSPTEGAAIFVSLDGSKPTEESPRATDGKVTISRTGTTTLRAVAVAENLKPSTELALVITIEREPREQTSVVVAIIGAVVVLLALVCGTVVLRRRRSQGQLIDAAQVVTKDVIGLGSGSVVYSGTYRGTDVAIKEFVSHKRMLEIINDIRARNQGPGAESDTTGFRANPTVHGSTSSMSHFSTSMVESASFLGSRHANQDTADSSDALVLRKQVKEFRREIHLLTRIRHPHIVAFLGAFEKGKRRGIVLELMERGSLADVLANTSLVLGWKERVRMGLETARGLAYLHAQSPPVFHHDVKSLNVLLDEKKVCKVSDFGAAVVEGGEVVDIGTAAWAAPEVLRKDIYSAACDVYSFGVVLWELASRREPSMRRSAQKISSDTLAGTRLPVDRSTWPAALCDLIEDCWAHSPADRPTMAAVVQRLAEMLIGLPDDIKNVDASSVTTGSLVVGMEAMKEMQTTLLCGLLPRAFVDNDLSVLFLSVIGFGELSARLDPGDIADLLGRLFIVLGELADEYGVRRFQTVGDTYIVIANDKTRPDRRVADATWSPEKAICEFGVAAVECASKLPVFCDDRVPPQGFHSLAIRAGVASGPVALQLVAFDRMEILGETVNLASRMEATAIRRRVQLTEAHFNRVRLDYPNAAKAFVDIKGMGPGRLKTYLIGETESPAASSVVTPAGSASATPSALRRPLTEPLRRASSQPLLLHDTNRRSPKPSRAVLPPLPGQTSWANR